MSAKSDHNHKPRYRSACTEHSFCQYMSVEDCFEFPFKDLKQLVKTISSNKKADIKAGFWGGVRMHPKESDLNYLKQIAGRMDDSRSVRRGVPIVTEEGLRY